MVSESPVVGVGSAPRAGERASDSRRFGATFLMCGGIAVAAAAMLVFAQNVLLARFFPHMSRLATGFSPAYLQRELSALAAEPGQILFLGDSVVWGFRLQPQETAVSLLAAQGCACRNLAYKHGSPANYYALVRVLQGHGVRPRAVVIEVNRADFSPESSGYRSLAGAVAQFAEPYLDANDRATLLSPRKGNRAKVDRVLGSMSVLYAMRLDIHEAMYGDNDPKPPPLTAELRRRIFDLPGLDETNVSVRYLKKTLEALRGAKTPVVAFLVPINHAALDAYVDRARYAHNSLYLKRLLARGGARVVDLDASFGASEFVDEAHLSAQGQARLASILAAELRRTVGDVTRSSTGGRGDGGG